MITAVIRAGGKGTRIRSVNSLVPKPRIRIFGKPVLQYQIEALKKEGITDIILVIGYLGNQISNYFKDGSSFDVSIRYIVEKEPLGTAGSLFYLKGKVSDDFLLLNGDSVFSIDINRFYSAHKKNHSLATILIHPNDHPYDSGLIVTDRDNFVTSWVSKEEPRIYYHNRVNAGFHFLNAKILNCFDCPKKFDLDRDVLKPLIKVRQLSAYDSPEYIKDMGTPERYQEVADDISSHKPQKRNLGNKQKAIFLDRDGTINKYVGFLTDIRTFELLPGVCEAIKKINHSDYLCIVATNQPVIARGQLSFHGLEEIHNKMETLLGNDGAYLDGIYFCPHHPDKGFDGEVKELKIECNCRKPKPGLLLKAAADFNIDLSQSFRLGDGKNDVLCGKNAGCKTGLISKEKTDLGQDYTGSSLADLVEQILGGK